MSFILSLENDVNSVETFVKTELGKITGVATDVVSTLENAATIGDGVVNALKTWLSSPQGQAVEAVIEAVPGIGPYATDVLNFIPTLFTDLNLAVADFNKSPASLVTEGITAAVNASTPNVKATNLAVIAAHITTFVSGLAGAATTIQTALTISPAAHVANLTPAIVQGAINNTGSSNVVANGNIPTPNS